jgi:hypothetical protein
MTPEAPFRGNSALIGFTKTTVVPCHSQTMQTQDYAICFQDSHMSMDIA